MTCFEARKNAHYNRLAKRRKDRKIHIHRNASYFDGTCEWWYDQQTRYWVVRRCDANGHQVGEADYVLRPDLADAIRAMAETSLDDIDPWR